MSLGSNRELAENKLILLYLIDKINMPINNQQITSVILENKFMNYFLLQQFLNELCESSFLSSYTVDGKTYYTTTQNGKQTLDYFVNLIPRGIKQVIDEALSSIRKNIKNETHFTANFTSESENEFIVNCKVSEDKFSIMDLKIMVGTKNDARIICENWKKHSQLIYSEIIDILTRER